MTWIWYALAGYLVISWVYMACSTILCRRLADGQGATIDPASALTWRGKILAGAVMMLLAPVTPLFFVLAYFQCRKQQQEWKRFVRTHRPHLFEQKHLANMPTELQGFVDECMPELLELGFVNLGDYLLKPEPLVLQGRCLMSGQGETVAAILMIDQQLSYSLTSILESGRFVETASVEFSSELLDKFDRCTQMAAVSAHGKTISQAYDIHCRSVAEFEVADGCRTLTFAPEQLQDVMRYENQVFGEIKFQWGELDHPPGETPAIPPKGRAVSITELVAHRAGENTRRRGPSPGFPGVAFSALDAMSPRESTWPISNHQKN